MQTSSILLVDIGNTSTQAALERSGHFTQAKRIPSRGQTWRQVRDLINAYSAYKIGGAMICSVVPELDGFWIREARRIVRGKVLQVGHRLNLGMAVRYPRPAAIGSDRLANASGAVEKYGSPVVVADFGTALTFDFVTVDRAFVGGIILPGPAVFAQSLAGRTALLPRFSETEVSRAFRQRGARLIGKSTEEAMATGIRLGYIGMVKAVFAEIMRDPLAGKSTLCVTGGYAELIVKEAGLHVRCDPLLTLRGISRIWKLNA